MDRRKLALILARLSSEHDGERLAALSAATRILEAEGMTWETALFGREMNRKGHAKVSSPVSEEAPGFVRPSTGMTIKEQLEFCLRRYKDLSLSDRMLLTAIRPQVDRGRELAPKNQRLLSDLVHEIRGRE